MPLTEDQSSVVAHRDDNKLVLALPGSGKTHLSIELAKQIINADINNLLKMVTFTRSSTRETEHRIKQLIGEQDLKRVEIKTFAKFILDQARPLLNGRALLMGAPHEAFKRRAIGKDEKDLQFLDTKFPTDYLESNGDINSLNGISKAYLQALWKFNKVDLTTLSIELIFAMREQKIEPLNFTHMIVDEFQDTSLIEYTWIKENNVCLDNKARSFTVVGDDDQSIYNWRGSSGYGNMLKFKEEFNAKAFLLRLCFRCAPEILAYAAELIDYNTNRLPKEMKSAKNKGGTVEFIQYSSLDLERAMNIDPQRLHQYKVETIKHGVIPGGLSWHYLKVMENYLRVIKQKRYKDKHPKYILKTAPIYYESHGAIAQAISKKPKGWAILARTNRLLDLMQEELINLDVPVERIGGKSIWETPIIVGFASLFQSLSNSKRFSCLDDSLSFLNLGNSIINTVHEIVVNEGDLNRVPTILLPENEMLTKFFNWSKHVPSGKNDAEMAEYLFSIFDESLKISEAHNNAQNKLRLVVDRLSSYKGSLKQRVSSLQRLMQNKAEVDHSNNEKVILSTMNGSKGLQWPNVWVMDVEENRAPTKYKGPEIEGDEDLAVLDFIEEERRLLYVAITRAESKLMVSYRENRASRFVAEMQLE